MRYLPTVCCAGLLALVSLATADEAGKQATPAAAPGVIFSSPLADVPGKHLVVVALDFGPPAREHSLPHRHPGSVYVYVTKGTVRLGLEGQPVKVVHAGESFFEPMGAVHTVAENVSATEPAAAIAVMMVPDGAPLLIKETPKR